MPNRNYTNGMYYEHKCVVALKDCGWYVIQSRGSKGCADITAIRHNVVLLVQVKSGVANISSREWNELFDLATMIGAVPVYVKALAYKPIEWRRMTDRRVEGSRHWPAETITIL